MPLAEGLQRKGIHMASRCASCNQNVENFEHVFISCDISSSVWSHFHGIFGLLLRTYTIQQRCYEWWLGSSSIIYTLLPSLILWNIWKSRNKAVYEDNFLPVRSIIAAIYSELHNYLSA